MDACLRHRLQLVLLASALCLGMGCHTTQPIKEEFAVAPVHQVHAIWLDKVVTTTDYGFDKGADLPGLVGRLYFMGADLGHTVRSNGRLVVDLYDAAQSNQPKFLGRWQIAKENVARLDQKDKIGLGYTLFLPLPPDFNPKSTKFQLQVSYLPDEGPAIYAARSSLALGQDDLRLLASRVQAQPLGQEQPVVTDTTRSSPGTVLVTNQEGH